MFVRAARLLLPATLLVGTASLVGCRHYIEYSDSPQVAQPSPSEGRVVVKVSQARVRGERVAVTTVVSNQSSKPLAIDRNDIGLQLADGRVVRGHRLRGGDDSGPIVIEPGSSRRVNVGFSAPRGTDLMAAKLLLNRVRFGNGEPQELGEVLFSKGRSTFGIGGPAVDAPDTEPAAAGPAEDAESAQQGPATEDSSDDAEPPAADDGSWRVGR